MSLCSEKKWKCNVSDIVYRIEQGGHEVECSNRDNPKIISSPDTDDDGEEPIVQFDNTIEVKEKIFLSFANSNIPECYKYKSINKQSRSTTPPLNLVYYELL